MQEFNDKVAVITGAAAGIGHGLAERCIKEGMKVVIADIDEDTIRKFESEWKDKGARVLAVPTDVSKLSDVEDLAKETLGTFGAVHLLCNNAGVIVPGVIWENTLADWEWVLGVNLWGVIHGIRVFVPLMLLQDSEAHIVNTASPAGLVAGPGWGIYRVTKHGVISLSETLYYDLDQLGAKLKVSILCPDTVNTEFVDSHRVRPSKLQNESNNQIRRPEVELQEQTLRQALSNGTSPDQVADQVFNGIREEKLYILMQFDRGERPQWRERVRIRTENILQEKNPV